SVTVTTGTSPHGQGHETAWAQIVADVVGVAIEKVTLVWGDTRKVKSGGGTAGSRSAQIGGSAIFKAGEAVWDKARQIAAHMLEASADDITRFEDGRVGVAGSPQSGLTWAELATAAQNPPEGIEPGLRAEHDFEQGASSFPFGAHV